VASAEENLGKYDFVKIFSFPHRPRKESKKIYKYLILIDGMASGYKFNGEKELNEAVEFLMKCDLSKYSEFEIDPDSKLNNEIDGIFFDLSRLGVPSATVYCDLVGRTPQHEIYRIHVITEEGEATFTSPIPDYAEINDRMYHGWKRSGNKDLTERVREIIAASQSN